jgi:sigma-B regulation protein RsbU (phosphoserine phosphatase)
MPLEKLPDTDTLYELAACGLVLTDANGLILRANQTFGKWLGYEIDDLVGKRRIQDLLNIGGRIFHQTHWAPLLKMQGSVAEVKLDFIQRNGQALPMLMNAVTDSYEGKVFHQIALFVATDRHKYEQELMAARKKSENALKVQLAAQRELTLVEARFHTAVEAAQLHVWHLDAQTGRRQFDDSVAQLLGLPGPQAVSAEKYLESIHPDDVERAENALIAATKPGATGYSVIYRLNGVDGIQRTVLSAGRAVFDSEGTLLQVIGILQDITDQARHRSEAEDRALFAEQMVGIVSHDLRNPLAVILGGTEMLSQIGLTADQEGLVQTIERAGNRAHRLISDLLDFTVARLGSGLHVSRKATDFHLLVSDSIEELKHAFPNQKIEHVRTGDGLIEVDPDRLTQALGNLVANAVAYGSSTGPVEVHSAIEDDQFTLSVKNYGAPISADVLPNLFKPMTRGVDNPGEAKSVGLGLFIVQEIVRAHAGKISVTSITTEGTTFKITIPRLGL